MGQAIDCAKIQYRIVEQHYPVFTVHLAEQGRVVPGYVQQEFEDYLKCGRLEHGFLRVRCESCHAEHLVAFSCKRRVFCPSCGARRMAERGLVGRRGATRTGHAPVGTGFPVSTTFPIGRPAGDYGPGAGHRLARGCLPSSRKSWVYEKVSPNGRRHPHSAVRLGTQSEY